MELDENDKRREYIINNYKHLIPDINDYVYERKNNVFDYRFLNRSFKEKEINNHYSDLAKVVVDIRNNVEPTGPESNTIYKTDNKFSNETKVLIKHLLSKGWRKQDVITELEKIYGGGIMTQDIIWEAPKLQLLIFYSVNIMAIYLAFKVGKFFYYRSYRSMNKFYKKFK